MKNPNRSISTFIKTVAASLFAVIIITVTFLGSAIGNSEVSIADATPVNPIPYGETIRTEINILVVFESRNLLCNLGIDTAKDKITATVVPENCVIHSNYFFDKNEPLESGEKIFSHNIKKYVYLCDKSLSQLTDRIGGVGVYAAFGVPSLNGNVTISGKQKINAYGRQLCRLFDEKCSDKAAYLSYCSSIISEFLYKFLKSSTPELMNSMFNLCRTNISNADFVNYNNIIKKSITGCTSTVLSGTFIGDNYYIYN